MRKYIVVASAAFTRRASHLACCSTYSGATSPGLFRRPSPRFRGLPDLRDNSRAITNLYNDRRYRTNIDGNNKLLAFAPPIKPSSRTFIPNTAASIRRWNTYKRAVTTPRYGHQTTRLFGSNPNSPDAKPGQINLTDDRDIFIGNYNEDDDDSADDKNTQITENNNNNNNNNLPSPTTPIIPIDLPALRRTIDLTRQILGYPTYDVSLTLVSSPTMRQINRETRGVDSPTDILSFCFQDDFVEPGVLGDVQFENIEEYYCLGDMVLDVEYVARRCEEDRVRFEAEGERRRKEVEEGVVVEVVEEEVIDSGTEEKKLVSDGNDIRSDVEEREEGDEDDEYEYEWIEVDEYDDRGVAPAMLKVFEPEVRCHMLIVHGMLHLVGYDHIEDDDYELMVEREDEVLAELRKILGDNFGVNPKLSEGVVITSS